ncbi:hypothetical protein FV139_13190 [Parahaliea maris]|uniref:TIGR04222 domain-containing membrane protein n=1 Tax=Parahaliea maris TaxID=2716870 RepID=A0A5C9A0H2_9GAMM|nr:hypothetical protein [Parahaliea maris]TXS92911.1 hypothetical protein FV139_13190 [Parahaliea maris]
MTVNLVLTALFGACLFVLYRVYRARVIAHRAHLIDTYRFPPSIAEKVIKAYPHLGPADAELVMMGLREYFQVTNVAGKRMVAMPSQVVDVAWHEFILFTRQYQHFCSKALGRFLHHPPAEAMVTPTSAQTGIKTAWRASCHREGIKPDSPTRLPLLFKLDSQLNIPDGFRYSINCLAEGRNDYCAGHIGCSSGCAGGCSGDSSGCGGGCGGD